MGTSQVGEAEQKERRVSHTVAKGADEGAVGYEDVAELMMKDKSKGRLVSATGGPFIYLSLYSGYYYVLSYPLGML